MTKSVIRESSFIMMVPCEICQGKGARKNPAVIAAREFTDRWEALHPKPTDKRRVKAWDKRVAEVYEASLSTFDESRGSEEVIPCDGCDAAGYVQRSILFTEIASELASYFGAGRKIVNP